METLTVRIPKLYEKRNLIMKNYTSVDRIREVDEYGGHHLSAETFMRPDTQGIVANYETDVVTMLKAGESKFINELLARKIAMEPIEITFVMRPHTKRESSN